jgi:hypothetical protein
VSRCIIAIDPSGAPVPDAHDQGKWRDEYVLCGAEVPAGDVSKCPKCGEEYWSMRYMEQQESAR